MKRTLLALCAILMTMVSCTNGDFEELYEPQDTPPVLSADTTTFYASLEGSDEQTKTYLDANIKLLWHAEDRISLFRSTLNEQFYFTGSTGANSGGFNLVPSDSWVTGNETSTNYGVYPYVETTSLTNAEEIRLTMPAVQSYAEKSFGKGANTMVAATESSASRFLPFRNVGGYLLLKLYSENASIKSITLEGNNGEVLSGSATVLAKYGYLPLLTMDETGGKSVTLDCGESGVKLSRSKDEPTQFWMVVPPTTFEGGFTLTITDTNGNVITKSTTKSQTIERNAVKSMAAFEIARTIANNEIHYTATAKVTPNATDVFGANITSNEWDSATGEGVITFDGDVTMIGMHAFRLDSRLKSIEIPKSVTSIGAFAFWNCSNLSSFKGEFASEDGRCLIVDGVLTAFAPSGITSYTIPQTVTTIGNGAFMDCGQLTEVVIPDGVVSILGNAFSSSGVTTIVMPNSITSIGSGAFYFAQKLASITLSDNLAEISKGAFEDCVKLQNVSGGSSIKKIGEAAFKSTALTSIAMPETLLEIGNRAFIDCKALTSVVIPNSVTSLGSSTFDGATNLQSAIIGNGVTAIQSNTFYGCTNLAEVTIGSSVKSIGDWTFEKCSSLSTVRLLSSTPPSSYSPFEPSSDFVIYVPAESVDEYKAAAGWSDYASYIQAEGGEEQQPAKPANNEIWYTNGVTGTSTSPKDKNAFGEASIKSNVYDVNKECWVITFDKDVTTIGQDAFYDRNALKTIILPESVTSIGQEAFSECGGLISIVLPDGITSIGRIAFSKCKTLTNITLPENLTTIEDRAFEYCTMLEDITIPEGVETIKSQTFYHCSSLTRVSIPEGVETIESQTFSYCSSLTRVSIPSSVKTIESYAFYNCDKLSGIICQATTPPTVGNNALKFDSSNLSYIDVPDGSINAYKEADGWKGYADKIQ